MIAWTEEENVLVKAGAIDIGERHRFKTVRAPKAAMWLNHGGDEDILKAKAYAGNERRVFVYRDIADPLGQARRDVMVVA